MSSLKDHSVSGIGKSQSGPNGIHNILTSTVSVWLW